MKNILIYLLFMVIPLYADYKPSPIPPPLNKTTEDAQAAKNHSINVNFSMGNSQQAPAQNQTEAKTTQTLKVEHTYSNPPSIPQETVWHRAYMSAIGGAGAAVGSYVISFVYNHGDKIVAVIRKVSGL